MSAVRTPIIDTLKSVNIELQESDKEVYREMLNAFTIAIDGKNEHAALFADILFLLTNKKVVDHLLQHLEADVKAMWAAESKNPSAQLALHQPKKQVRYAGLLWPHPEPELAANRSNHLLSRVLLKTEQAHGINLGELQSAPVPTFIGLVDQYGAEEIVRNRQVWNEESKLSSLFYHGKMLHRTQLCLIMKAIDLKLLDLGDLTIPTLLEVMARVPIGTPLRLVWNILLDNIESIRNIKNIASDPFLSVLENQYPPVIYGNEYKHPYLYGCDPYFLHSYLMTVSREKTPYLSECVTQMFAKSAFAIQRLERKIGKKYDFNGYFRQLPPNIIIGTTKLSEQELHMDEVLKRQAYCFAEAGAHFLDASDIIADQRERGKKTDVRDSGTVTVQYRAISVDKPNDGSWFQFFKRATMPLIQRVTETAINILKV